MNSLEFQESFKGDKDCMKTHSKRSNRGLLSKLEQYSTCCSEAY